MQLIKYIALSVFLFSCSTPTKNASDPIIQKADLNYSIDLNNQKDDQFYVTLVAKNLTIADSIYQFVATIPGSYSQKDFGRYVQTFIASDSLGNNIHVEKRGLNGWFISAPTAVKKISYEIRETWDFPLDTHEVSLMGGSSIEKDHVLFNSHAVIGYFPRLQHKTHRLDFEYPKGWLYGSQNELNNGHLFFYKDFAEAVDSPLLFGNLTVYKSNVDGVDLEIYLYSKTGLLKAEQFGAIVDKTYRDFQQFIQRKPVKKYTFLFHFEDQHYGALEHLGSSVYVYKEEPFEELSSIVRDVVAHEIFHLETPLYIRSERIANFDYSTPKPVKHLWFYEGVTEWASHIFQLRSGGQTPDEFFKEHHQKIDRAVSKRFDQSLSLVELSEMSYTREDEYINIYQKGALIAMLLDIHILDVTDGKKGLRETLIELAKKYNLQKPFNSETFFDDVVAASHPSVREFIDRYIAGAEPMPLRKYFNKIGIKYYERLLDEQGRSDIGFDLWKGNDDRYLTARNVDETMQAFGLMEHDSLISINGNTFTDDNIIELFKPLKLRSTDLGVPYKLTVKRGENLMVLDLETVRFVFRHVFRSEYAGDMTEKVQRIRKKWFNSEF